MPELRERTSSIQAGMVTSRWAPFTNAQSPRLAQGPLHTQPSLPAMTSMSSAASTVSQPMMTPAASQSVVTLPSNTATVSGPMQDPSRFYPKDRQLINTLTGEVVVPMTFPPRDVEKEEAWKKHNQDFMTQAKKVLGMSKVKAKENDKTDISAQNQSVRTASTSTNNAPRQEPPSTAFRIPPPGDRAIQIRKPEPEPRTSNDDQHAANILTQMRSNPNCPSLTNGAQNGCYMQHTYVNYGAANGQTNPEAVVASPVSLATPSGLPDVLHKKVILHKDSVSKATSLIKSQQISASMHQVIARDITAKYNASRKVIKESAGNIKHLHSTILDAAKTAESALQTINNIELSLTAATESFTAAVLPPDLDDRARDVLENHLRSLDRAQIVAQIQALAIQPGPTVDHDITPTQAVNQANTGVLVSFEEETTATASVSVQRMNGVSSNIQDHRRTSIIEQPAPLVDLSDTSLQSVEVSTAVPAELDCKYSKSC
jgi:hypothetical protein